WKGHAELFDAITHKRVRLVGLTKLLNRPGHSHGSHPVDFQLSPTGTRLYWWAYHGYPGIALWRETATATTASMEGSQLREWRTRPGTRGLWTDDAHFAEVKWDGR